MWEAATGEPAQPCFTSPAASDLRNVAETFKSEARRLGGPSLAHKLASFGRKVKFVLLFTAEARGLLARSLGVLGLSCISLAGLSSQAVGQN